MVLIDELQTGRYYRSNDQYLSTSGHFHDHPIAVSVQYHPNPTKRASSARPFKHTSNTSTITGIGSLGTTPAALMKVTSIPPGTAEQMLASMGSGAGGRPARAASARRSADAYSFGGTATVSDASLASMGMPRYLYKANGTVDLTVNRLDLPRPHSARLSNRDQQARKSEYQAHYLGRTAEPPTLAVKTGRVLSGSIASRTRMSLNGLYGYDGGLAPDRPL